MKKLEPPNSFRLSAAEGWLGLGDIAEAMAELEQIPGELQEHPDVLETRWEIFALQHRWPAALEAARRLLQLTPENSAAWLHHAYSLRRSPEGGLRAAWNALAPALDKFPGNAIVPYNLACYACQLDELDKARILFKRALASGNRQRIKEMAVNDRDLEPLWGEIRGL